ncbi:hypothetical protein DPMN_164377 [Dreissena polymorpha]|uniref:Uncharacterized protein n=1 Tax=Dreissena polymorpha TaxID=45954 RepID=A0A9D4DUA6_DREPO|nr:hypothetical protein DPMN_190503 [Dreissena polymorpha]KAH3786271.1 hypothetical protein DPMN_164377 [Dreissena polymorpha]
MCPGISDDLLTTDDATKTTIIDGELIRLNIYIAALQETIPQGRELHFLLEGEGART